jgi:hypothetical protein
MQVSGESLRQVRPGVDTKLAIDTAEVGLYGFLGHE